jgi:hypothetical protein
MSSDFDINLAMSPPYFRIVPDQFSLRFAVEGTIHILHGQTGNEPTAERAKTALIAGLRVQTPDFRAFGFSEEPMKAGRHRVSKRTLKVVAPFLHYW